MKPFRDSQRAVHSATKHQDHFGISTLDDLLGSKEVSGSIQKSYMEVLLRSFICISRRRPPCQQETPASLCPSLRIWKLSCTKRADGPSVKNADNRLEETSKWEASEARGHCGNVSLDAQRPFVKRQSEELWPPCVERIGQL